MLTQKQIHDATVNAAVRAVTGYAGNRTAKTPSFQILDLIMPRERRIRSIVGGLETSMGQTFWELLAKDLASLNGFEVLDGSTILAPNPMPVGVTVMLERILDARIRETGEYSARMTKQAIQQACQIHRPATEVVWKKPPSGSGVDVWIEKDGVNYIFDTKTVQPNIGALRSFMTQIIYWYSYFFAKFPDAILEARIVFPYNPYSPSSFWSSIMKGGRPLEHPAETWVEAEFWDFCSGRGGTFPIIRNALKHVGDENLLADVLAELFN